MEKGWTEEDAETTSLTSSRDQHSRTNPESDEEHIASDYEVRRNYVSRASNYLGTSRHIDLRPILG